MRIGPRYTTKLAAIGPAYRGPARRDDPGGPAGGAADGGAGGSGDGDAGTGDIGGKPADGDGTGKPKITGDLDPDRAARAIAAARDGEKKAKQAAAAEAKARQDLIDSIGVALGLKVDPKTDPAEAIKQAAAERDQAVQTARDSALQLAVYRRAGKAGADPDALLDSKTFLGSVAALDPSEADFDTKVEAAIKDAVKANGKLAAATGAQGGQGPARQGADHTGGSGGKQRPTSLGGAIAAALNRT